MCVGVGSEGGGGGVGVDEGILVWVRLFIRN